VGEKKNSTVKGDLKKKRKARTVLVSSQWLGKEIKGGKQKKKKKKEKNFLTLERGG